ncbi:histidine triad-like protein [Chaetomium sp. MPI-CAGE-AT-0009]|nr:histidine triad-like protein [Chaetomium sp. MPI-CAGE-AT-0009]
MTIPADDMGTVKIPVNLPELVRTAFNRARASGDVHFFPTQVTLVNVNSVPFQLRFSPALANKPSAPQPPAPSTDAVPPLPSPSPKEAESKKQTSKPFFDPFDNPPTSMLITPLAPSHNLVLNKFAIVPEHFILATHPEDQTPHTRKQTQTQDQERDLYVFFNSGPASGSSQPHRHIQMLPVARMREGLAADEAAAWEALAGALVREDVRGRLPFTTFVGRIGPGVDLMEVYLGLYRRACEAVLGSGGSGGSGGGLGEVMVIAPRVVEGALVTVPGEGGARREVGKLALNGTVLAGTALVKTQAEWDALREDPEQVVEILGRIGVPKVQAPAPA